MAPETVRNRLNFMIAAPGLLFGIFTFFISGLFVEIFPALYIALGASVIGASLVYLVFVPKSEHKMAASERELYFDVEYLLKVWSGIQSKAREADAPSLLYRDLNLSLRVLRDMVNEDTGRILIDARETYRHVLGFAQDYIPNVAERVQCYMGERPLFDLYGVEDETVPEVVGRLLGEKGLGLGVLDLVTSGQLARDFKRPI